MLKPEVVARKHGTAASDETARIAGDRMLAAIVPRGETSWFFKLTGPNEAVANEMKNFVSFIRSLNFPEGGDGDGEPTWSLPPGWKLSSAAPADSDGMVSRFATVQIDTKDTALELSVTPLPTVGGVDDFVLQNVNRWRGQMGLELTTRARLLAQTQEDEGAIGETARLLVDGSTATLVNLEGTLESGSSGRAPFALRRTPPRRGLGAVDGTIKAALKYDVPEGWSPAAGTALSAAAFKVSADGQSAEITVTALGAAAGDLPSNVNRWRTQIGLDAVASEQIREQLETLEVDGTEGAYVELMGPEKTQPREAILGVIVVRDERAWFFKLKGDADLARREKSRFESFVRSVQFNSGEGTADGN